MKQEGFYDPDEIKRTLNKLKPNGELFEVRVLGDDKRKIYSGYFSDPDTLIEAFNKVDLRGANVYMTLNTLNEAVYSRKQSNKFVLCPQTTSDTDVTRYKFLFIDFDPVRLTGVSSSDEELSEAKDLMQKVKTYLLKLGFPAPVVAMSGNGYHLLYQIDLPNDQDSTTLISNCLKALAMLFNNEKVKIDTVNSNPSRVCKLHGTLAQKGTSTTARPHRMSCLIENPELKTTSKECLLALVKELPVEESKPATPASKLPFNIEDFMARHGMTYKLDTARDCTMYQLDECPFDHSHKNGDAKIFAYTNGAIAFKCHHNSCSRYRWEDVRLKFEPEAYDYKQTEARIEEGYKEHKAHKDDDEDNISYFGEEVPQQKKKKIFRNLKTADGLMKKVLPEPKVFVGVGDPLPLLVEGTCILSAKPKLGKSWFALALCIAIAKGEEFLGYKTNQCSTLYLDLETSEQIEQKRIKTYLKDEAVPSNFYLETETDTIEKGFVEQIEHYLEEDPDIGVVVVDVFQIIRSQQKSIKETEYEHAYRDITPLNILAQKRHISIILVCHDRKAVDFDDPFSNILGSTGLQGAATQMIVMFRKNKSTPIHISVKGKTIDGLPELDVKLEDARWRITAATGEAAEMQKRIDEFKASDIRDAVFRIHETMQGDRWRGTAGELISRATSIGCPIVEDAKRVGGFLFKNLGLFLKIDGIQIDTSKNGTGGRTYIIQKNVQDFTTVSDDFEFQID